jgi:hypothetical protein
MYTPCSILRAISCPACAEQHFGKSDQPDDTAMKEECRIVYFREYC